MVISLLFIATVNVQANISLNTKSNLYLIVALSLEQDKETTTSWEKGREILPGAQTAVDAINNRSDILPGYNLHTIQVDIGRCGSQNHNFLLQYINVTYHQTISYIGAVGIFCPAEVQLLGDPLMNLTATKKSLESVVEAARSHKMGESSLVSSMIEALLEFLDAMEWRTVAAITKGKDSYFTSFMEMFYRASKQHRSNFTVVMYNYASNIRSFMITLPRIVIVSVTEPLVTEILCSAYELDIMWPRHVWILHTYHLETLYNLNTSCNIEMALENILILSDKVPASYNENIKNAIQYSKQEIVSTNFYSVILHNLVWSMALAVNETIATHLQAMNNVDMTPQKHIIIIHIRRNSTRIQIAEYYSRKLSFSDLSFKSNAPSDTLLTVTKGVTPAYTATFLTEIIVGFILVTAMLIGYCCFRNQPEVKSTSFTLSLLVFLGCYLMLVYLSILLYFHQPWAVSEETLNGLCISLNWFSGLGVPNALMLTTVLVKILRIHHIFSKSTPSALSKKCSDTYLAVYVILILSPLIFVQTLWTILDPYLGFLKVTTELNVVRYEKQCQSNYTLLWYALLAVYILTIFLILFVTAIKMRKIRVSNFNDFRKVSLLVACYFIDLILTLTCWRVLYMKVNAYYAAIVLHLGHITAITLCQLLLFAPKVIPPLARHMGINSRKPVPIKAHPFSDL